MKKKSHFLLSAIALLILALIVTTFGCGLTVYDRGGWVPPYANSVSQTGNFILDRWTKVDLESGGIILREIRFTTETKATTGPFGMSTARGPYMSFVVYNDSGYELDYGISVALFDRNGNLTTANSYSHPGTIKPGERHEGAIVFGEVNKRYHESTKFKIVLETY